MFKNNPILHLFKYTWRYSKSKKIFITFICMSIIANIIGLMEPLVVSRIFNNVQFSSDDPELFSYIARNVVLLIAITLGFWFFHGVSRVMEQSNSFIVRKKYKQEMFDKVLDLPTEWHKDHHSGDTIDKINKAGDRLKDFAESIFHITGNATAMIGAIIILALYDWQATVIALVASIIAVSSILRFDKILIKLYLKIFKKENYLAAGIYDYISNIITVITLRLKPRASREIGRRLMAAYPTYKKALPIQEFKWFLVSLYITLMTVSIILINAYQSLITKGVIIIGTLFILYQYLRNIGEGFFTFAWRWGEIVREDAAVRAAKVITDEHKKLKAEKKYLLPDDWRVLQIKNLNFTYRGGNMNKKHIGHLSDVSVTIERNKRIAFIGESGSGKSTIFALMRGLHLPSEVKMFSNGKHLEQGMAHLYEHVTLIPQEPELFNTSIKDNITMGINTDKKEINRVLEFARFSDVVKRLKNGLNTNVMEKGVSLSGGEKQRLALARGLLAARDSQILLLDEPTSSVDSENELIIYQNIFANFKDYTIMAAVHRLHLLKFFDYIYYFKDGKIITEGTFHTLLKDDRFKKIWELYNEEKK